MPEPGWAGPAPSTVDDRLGEVIDGRYRLESLISSGSMGRVYKAQQLNLDRVVAVKVMDLDPTLIRAPEVAAYQQRFLNEASALARLQQPSTVRIFDHGVVDGVPFIVMEYLQGRSLADVIRREAPLDLERVVALADGICRSLDEAHAAGVVHRDLKPSNILVLEDADGTARVKVLDFGLVKLTDASEALTQMGQLLGSPNYMAPEVIREQHDIDGRADLYALGVILFRMLTGKLPYGRGRPAAVLIAHLQQPVPSLQSAEPGLDLPKVVNWTVSRCLAKSRDERFATARSLRIALHACLRASHQTGAWDLQLRLEDGVLTGYEAPLDATLSTPAAPLHRLVFDPPAPQVQREVSRSPRGQSGIIAGLAFLLLLVVVGWGLREWTTAPASAAPDSVVGEAEPTPEGAAQTETAPADVSPRDVAAVDAPPPAPQARSTSARRAPPAAQSAARSAPKPAPVPPAESASRTPAAGTSAARENGSSDAIPVDSVPEDPPPEAPPAEPTTGAAAPDPWQTDDLKNPFD